MYETGKKSLVGSFHVDTRRSHGKVMLDSTSSHLARLESEGREAVNHFACGGSAWARPDSGAPRATMS